MRAPPQSCRSGCCPGGRRQRGCVVGGGKRGVLQLGADEQVLGGVFLGKAAAREIEQLFVTDVTDGGAVVAGDVVLVAEDDGNGLVVDALVDQKHGLALGADGALAAVHEVDGAA